MKNALEEKTKEVHEAERLAIEHAEEFQRLTEQAHRAAVKASANCGLSLVTICSHALIVAQPPQEIFVS